ncbi:MAG: YdcF family protein [Solobacterium sp.]|nr:YdcF family protein [Solobacterium sp.]
MGWIRILSIIFTGITAAYVVILFLMDGINLRRLLWLPLLGIMSIPILVSKLSLAGQIFWAGIMCIGITFLSWMSIQIHTASTQSQKMAEVLIVLGCKVPSRALNQRVRFAWKYYQSHPEVQIIASGGQGKDESESEAYAIRTALVKLGVKETQIQMEETSVSTYENLKNSRSLIGEKTTHVGIVTSSYHVFRSVKIAEHLDYPEPFGIPAESIPFYYGEQLLSESVSFLLARIRKQI